MEIVQPQGYVLALKTRQHPVCTAHTGKEWLYLPEAGQETGFKLPDLYFNLDSLHPVFFFG
jgi:hypothetical protein